MSYLIFFLLLYTAQDKKIIEIVTDEIDTVFKSKGIPEDRKINKFF